MKTVDKETIRAVAEVEKAVAIVKESLPNGDFSRSVDELERRVHKLRCLVNAMHQKQTNRTG